MIEKFKAWFVNKINFCENYFYGTDIPKPPNKIYDWFYEHWLWPYEQTDCVCCNTVRGLIYGFILGYIIGGLF